jgi:hypothetical protein
MGKAKDLAAITLKVHGLVKDMTQDERQKVIGAVMTLFGEAAPAAAAHTLASGGHLPATGGGGKLTQSLASYLSAQQAGTNQVKRFLATADWLRRKGASALSTAAVSKTLKENHQAKLGNPSDCLNQNVAKGFAEKDGKDFYITPEGLKSLGHHE